MDLVYDTAETVSVDTLALIFRDGQVDEFGRVWPLAVFGRTSNGRCITVTRNVSPSLYSVRRVLASAQACGMTHLTVGPDVCG